jgi:F-type H+-transporting ATPase subunit alpha
MFSRFGGLGDEKLRRRIAHGERISALLAQPRFSPLRSIDQIALLSALAKGELDDVPVEVIARAKQVLPDLIDADSKLSGFAANPTSLGDEQTAALIDAVRQALARAAQVRDTEGDQ